MVPTDELSRQIQAAMAYIKSRWSSVPKVGIVLGTGAGAIAKSIEVEALIPYESIPHFPISTAIGHKGQLVCGRFAGANVIAMQGRFHLYEGYDVDAATLAVHMMAAMGVEMLLVSNAAGGVNTNWEIGDVMLINSHIDFMWRASPALGRCNHPGRPTGRCDRLYSAELISSALKHARQCGFVLYEGVYAAMLGPNYETRAEYRFLKKIGADVVGMSTVPEVAAASQYGLNVLAMSVVTNIAKPDAIGATLGTEVVDVAAIAAPKLKSIVENTIRSIPSIRYGA